MEKKSFILSIVALAVSIVTLAVIFFRVTPNSVIDLGTFIGVMTALIGISITFLVGYQIYNAIEIRRKLAEVDRLKSELETANNNLAYLKSDIYEGVYNVAALTAARPLTRSQEAFMQGIIALRYALDLHYDTSIYDNYIVSLEKYLLLIGNKTFVDNRSVTRYMEYWADEIEKIKEHGKYNIIRRKFQRLIDAYHARMRKIQEGKPVSTNDVYADIE